MKKNKDKNSNANLLISINEFETNNEEENKKFIANKIKCIHENDIELDFEALKNVVNAALLSTNTNDNNVKGGIEFKERVGNNIVDFFTFKERLETRGKYNIHFYDFN